ncbi:HNH endonuclease [Actinomyces ihuae]|uniref:HNH endonuclease n=1 Tax=Actinomyces ihuae TaxID=1673722 RepID=UPI00093CCFC7
MVTSRTGTSKWKRVAAQAKRQAQAAGITHCPRCHAVLDYAHGRTPVSAEADHIVPHALGGKDTIENVQVLCRRCNQSKGAGRVAKSSRARRVRAKRIRIESSVRSSQW